MDGFLPLQLQYLSLMLSRDKARENWLLDLVSGSDGEAELADTVVSTSGAAVVGAGSDAAEVWSATIASAGSLD